jgi:hypothetical protein
MYQRQVRMEKLTLCKLISRNFSAVTLKFVDNFYSPDSLMFPGGYFKKDPTTFHFSRKHNNPSKVGLFLLSLN